MSARSKPQSAQAPASKKKAIFNAASVAKRLGALKQAWVAASEAAAQEGKEVDGRWWAPALAFGWASLRKANQGTLWGNVEYTDEAGVSGRLVVRVLGERHSGQIMPSTAEGVAELTARMKNPKSKIEKRDKKPTIQIQKWAAQVKTADDDVTVLADEQGNPILPGDDKLSPYHAVAALVGEAFAFEARMRLDRGQALLEEVAAAKKASKSVTAAEVLAAFHGKHGPARPGDTILSSDSVTSGLRKYFTDQKELAILTKGVIVASNTKIAPLVQEFVSDKAQKNQGAPLPNPIARITLEFDKDTGVAQFSLFDKTKPYVVEGKTKYDAAMVEVPDGRDEATGKPRTRTEPVNDYNVHYFLRPRSRIDGVINVDSICFSNMGISMPVKGEVVVAEPPSGRRADIDDVYGDEDGEDDESGEEAQSGEEAKGEAKSEAKAEAAAGSKPAAPAKAPAKAPAAAAAKPAAAQAKPPAPQPEPHVSLDVDALNDLVSDLEA